MNFYYKIAFTFLVIIAGVAVTACDRGPKSSLKGQTNTTLTFFGKTVDQDGNPLAGVEFEYQVQAYPKDWTFDSRGRDNDVSTVKVVSDELGDFQFQVTGCMLIRMKSARSGYQHFYDLNVGGSRAIDNTGYRLIAWSDLWYKSDPQNPAVYVFVNDEKRTISVLPCRGGSNSGGSTRWTPNMPGWPKKPSLSDVVQKPPTSRPATNPS